MDWEQDHLAETIQLFKQHMEIYLEDEGIDDKAKQALKIKRGLGDEGLRRLNASELSEADLKDPKKIWDLLIDQTKIDLNPRLKRLQLAQYSPREGETLDDFVNRARLMAKQCQFTPEELTERILELLVASTNTEKLRDFILSKPINGLTLQETLKEGRQYEALTASKAIDVHAMRNKLPSTRTNRHQEEECQRCGLVHQRRCPAYKDTCRRCGFRGHWEVKCRSRINSPYRQRFEGKNGNKTTRSQSPTTMNRNPSEKEDHTDKQQEFQSITVDSMRGKNKEEEAFVTLNIMHPQKYRLKLKLDTGASGNTIPCREYKKMFPMDPEFQDIKPLNGVKLTAYNGQEILCHGIKELTCEKAPQEKLSFYIVDVPGPAILGLPSCRTLGLITIHCDNIQTAPIVPHKDISIEQLLKQYPDCFDKIGDFKVPAKLYVRADAEPYQDPPRKFPLLMKDKLQTELKKLEDLQIIRKVVEHTDWCSSLAYTEKKDGSLRICIDPQPLNKALKPCKHKTPTTEEVNPLMANAKYFSKLDAKAGYWAVPLEESSQLLTTFRTPFGRYCWKRLPFGLCVSQDLFQQRMDQIVETLQGCINIADDICIVGKTAEEHDRNLIALMERARESGLVFNSDKCIIKQSSIPFFGHLYTRQGIQPDPAKVVDIKEMPTPQNRQELQRFLGMMNYLSPFIANFSAKSAPLRQLLGKDSLFLWEDYHQKHFEELKSTLCANMSLAYYDTKKPVTLEVDASEKGLGAALIQNNKPIAFASKSLTEAESNYSNIEREALALAYGINKFHTYLYGKSFIAVTDHKPLVTIIVKPIQKMPGRIARIFQKTTGYKFQLMYKPGKQMIIADTLSRLPNQKNKELVELDARVHSMVTQQEISFDEVDMVQQDFCYCSTQKKVEIRTETANEPSLLALTSLIRNGWPESIKEIPSNLRQYWSIRDELTVEDGILFKGKQLVIPEVLREEILKKLHIAHQGIEKTKQLAREAMYWPNMTRDIESMVKRCAVCQENQPQNKREPLIPHEVPDGKWCKIGADMFEISGCHYLLIADYFTKFHVVMEMKNTKCKAITEEFAKLCSIFGKPNEIITDNGPQFVGTHFKDFCKTWGISHITSSPHHPQSNGFIERMVATIKSTIIKCKRSRTNLHQALLMLRATPIDTHLPSPGELLFGTPLKTTLPYVKETGDANKEVKRRLSERQMKAKQQYDQNASSDLEPLTKDQNIRIRDFQTGKWHPGKVIKALKYPPRSYIVATENGRTLRRNRRHLRPDMDREEKRMRSNILEPKRVRFNIPEPNTRTGFSMPTPNTPEPPDVTENQETVTQETAEQSPTTRSGRLVKRPQRYNDFYCYD